MNEYKTFIMMIKDSIGYGLAGLILGLISYPESLSLTVVFKYTLCAIITGAFVYNTATNSEIDFLNDYKYIISVASSWASFFIVKGLTIILMRFSINPIQTTVDAYKAVRGKNK